MRITVINGTEKHGVTYELKEIFLSTFRGRADITEYYLPGDCPIAAAFRNPYIEQIRSILTANTGSGRGGLEVSGRGNEKIYIAIVWKSDVNLSFLCRYREDKLPEKFYNDKNEIGTQDSREV